MGSADKLPITDLGFHLGRPPSIPDMVVPSVGPGQVGLIGSRSAADASAFALRMAAAVVLGRDHLGLGQWKPRKGRVLIVCLNDRAERVAERVNALSATMPDDDLNREVTGGVLFHADADDGLRDWMCAARWDVDEQLRGLRDVLARVMPRLLVLDSGPGDLPSSDVMQGLEKAVAGLGCGVVATHPTHSLAGEPYAHIAPPNLTRWVLRGMTDHERAMRGLTQDEASAWIAVEGPPLDGGSGVLSALLPSDLPKQRPKHRTERWMRRVHGGVLVPQAARP